MSGAYTALPAVPPEEVPVVPTPPPGWDLDWTFPGPYPPGYVPEYTLDITGPVSIEIGQSAAIKVTLRDHETFITKEPSSSQVVSSSTLEGDSVSLRIGGSTYYSIISSDYIDVGSAFWGIDESFEFEAPCSAVGKIITFCSTSTIDGYEVSDTLEIAITLPAGAGDEADCDVEDCEDYQIDVNGTLPDCANASAIRPVETYLGSFDVNACTEAADTYCTNDNKDAIETAGAEAIILASEWSALQSTYCTNKAALEELECELTELQCLQVIREAYTGMYCSCDAGSATCSNYQDSLAEVEAEIVIAEAAIEALGPTVTADLAAVTAKAIELDAKADESIALLNAAVRPSTQYFYSTGLGTAPITDSACADLGPTCAGRDPLRCVTTFYIYRKVHYVRCTTDVIWYSSGWVTMVSGRYTPSGKPYATTMYPAGCGGIPAFSCSASPGGCDGSGDCGNGCGANLKFTYEVMMYQYYPRVYGDITC